MSKIKNAFLSCFGKVNAKIDEMTAPSVPGKANAPSNVPDFVYKYAPLLHLHPKDQYGPSDISAQLSNSTPKQEFALLNATATATTPAPPSPLTLDNIDQLNLQGKKGENIYLTSNEDIAKIPTWIKGVVPDKDGKTNEAVSCVVVVVEKEGGIVDVFYFYFFAFNWGGIVLGKNLGNHVGDWEHTMVRFVDGKPKFVWLSQHSGGQAYTYEVLKKDKSGLRPVVYCAQGSHAVYAIPGLHNHDNADFHLPTPGFVNDYTEAGPIWDPIASAYWYQWAPPVPVQPPNRDSHEPQPPDQTPLTPPENPTRDTKRLGTFVPYDAQTSPVGYLYFVGRWGDFRYPKNDPRQDEIFTLAWKYDSGPTGPAFKNLVRKEVWSGKSGRILKKLVA